MSGFKNIKQKISTLLITGIILLLFVLIGCGGGGSSDGGGGDEFEDIVLTSGKTWTIMCYIDADCNLESALLQDIAEMKAGFVNDQSVKLIVLIDRIGEYSNNNTVLGEDFTDTRLYEITNGAATRISGSSQFSDITTTSTYEANMGDANTLKKFIQFCKANYHATDYALIMSNHGGGAKKKSASVTESSLSEDFSGISKSICWDETNGDDFLYTAEISDVLTSAESVQLFGLDACLMSSVEFAYQFRNDAGNGGFKADIMVASAPTETGNGWQYRKIFERLNSVVGNNGEADKTLGGIERIFDPATVTPKIFGAIIVEEQRDSTTTQSDQSLTCLDLSKVKSVKDAVDVLAVSLINKKDDLETLRGSYPASSILNYFDNSSANEWIEYPFFDLYNLSAAISDSGIFIGTIQGNAKTVRDAVDSLVLYSFANSDFTSVDTKLNFIANKSGVHIFFPDGDAQAIAALYLNGDSVKDNVNLWYWQDWYNSKTAAEQQAVYPSYTSAPYGNLSWCKDGINPTVNVVGNWFELLDSWYDTQWENNSKGGFNAYQW